jgi:hypothetical protein
VSAAIGPTLHARHGAPVASTAQAVTRPPFEVPDIIRHYGTRFIEAHRAG